MKRCYYARRPGQEWKQISEARYRARMAVCTVCPSALEGHTLAMVEIPPAPPPAPPASALKEAGQ